MAQERQEPITFTYVASQVTVRYDGANLSLLEQLDRALQKAAKHLGSKRGAKAEFTMKVKLAKGGDEADITVTLEGKESNIPPLPLKAYIDRYDSLVADDPRQQDLPLEMVPAVRQA